MIESAFNVNQFINSKKQELIEAFVMFYGEEERENITTKFMNTPFIGYVNRKDARRLIEAAKKEVNDQAEKYFFDRIGPVENLEDVRKNLLSYSGFNGYSINLLSFYKAYEAGDKDLSIVYLKNIMGNQELTFDDPKINEYIEYAYSFKSAVEEAKNIYDNLLNEKYGYLIQYGKESDQNEKEVEASLDQEYINYIYQFLSDEDKKIVDSGSYIRWYNMRSSQLFGDSSISYRYSSPVDYFTSKSDELLNDPNTPSYQIDNIKSSRMKYYKVMTGLDFKTYEEYIDKQEVKDIMPDSKICDEVVEMKDKFKIKEEELIIRKDPKSKEILDLIESKNYLEQNDMLTDVMLNSYTCLIPNYVKNGDNIELSPLVFISSNMETSSFDCRLVHECNHLYESTLTNVEGSRINTVVGWDRISNDIAEVSEVEFSNNDKRQYEMFNEIINELIAQDITAIMHENGTYLCGDEQTAGKTSQSGYQMLAPLVLAFYQAFKPEIIASRKTGDLTPIFEKIGEENFEKINNLINSFNERFAGMKIYAVYSAMRNKKETQDLKDYYEYMSKRDEIYSQIKEYTNTHENISL